MLRIKQSLFLNELYFQIENNPKSEGVKADVPTVSW